MREEADLGFEQSNFCSRCKADWPIGGRAPVNGLMRAGNFRARRA
jgi:hypothetical protein